ncbi:MAG: MoaD family protein [Candidatus Latescibacteria bacterium]|nr:MoaD family protein [Candidatus Latescibacterota bacterium]NIO28408.1 MoaD family protein [Candidatus Latescibacterota bacterium]NIO55957.1 MoaD family protein [Candidatus Latescibacterota bacterium]NIT01921.1 MoaD family protein [Candidatus Latescibacterota bacterium]
MSVRVLIPSALRRYIEDKDTVEIEARTVEELLDKLVSQHDELRRQMLTEDGGLRGFINIYVNDQDIRYLDKYQTRLKSGDVVTIVPAIAGGVA